MLRTCVAWFAKLLLETLLMEQFATAFIHINIELISITADNFYIYHQGLKFMYEYISLFIYL